MVSPHLVLFPYFAYGYILLLCRKAVLGRDHTSGKSSYKDLRKALAYLNKHLLFLLQSAAGDVFIKILICRNVLKPFSITLKRTQFISEILAPGSESEMPPDSTADIFLQPGRDDSPHSLLHNLCS